MQPDEDVISRTKKRCEEEQRKLRSKQETMKKFKKGTMIAVPAAAVLLIGVFLGAVLFPRTVTEQPQLVAYYTVDVNPSLRVQVDAEDVVTGVKGQNADADAIIKKLDCVGDNVTDAIGEIINAIKDAGYFNEGQRYVLIGGFAADGTKVNNSLSDLQSRLEADFGDMIDLLIVQGNLDDLQAADDLQVSPGLLKLSQMADGVEVKAGEKVDDVQKQVQNVNEPKYCAPDINSADPGKDGVTLKWDSLDFTMMGYAGKVTYGIAMGDTKDAVTSMSATEIKKIDFYTYQTPPVSYYVSMKPGETKYFAIYAHYGDIVKRGNAIPVTIPAAAPSAAPAKTPQVSKESEPVKTDAPEPSNTAEPKPSETPQPAHYVSGKVSGEKIVLSWSAETAANFQGYKVVASKTNPNPKYPEDGYLKYITDRSKTSVSLYAGGDLDANEYYYFSITYLLSDGTKIAGNAVKLKVPERSPEPEPSVEPTAEPTVEPTAGPTAPPPPADHPSASIGGGITDSTISLSWSRIADERFQGYKVVASFSNPNPSYPGDGYLYYITNRDDTSKSFNVSKLGSFAPGSTCYFSITVLYNDGTKKAGNAIALTMPAAVTPPAEYASSSIHASLEGTTVHLSWGQINDPRFNGYKVVYSLTNPNPKYPDDGYKYYITEAGNTGCSFDVSELGGSSTAACYFSITVLYNDGVKVPGNVATITIP